MYNVLTLNKIAKVGTSRLGDNYCVGDDVENPQAVLVRSAAMHDMELPESLLAIARAGAGVNNIPLDKCSEKGIVVFNTPGANANAVKELVITALLLASRKVVDGIEWAKTLKGNGDAVGKMVEKGKSQFAGPEIKGKTLGVIGLGAIGVLVANAAAALGMDVIGYDPFLSEANKAKLCECVKHTTELDEIFTASDYITIHVPSLPDTKGMINAANIAKMKDGVRIVNYSRADLVVSADILKAISEKKIAAYVTDFGTDDILGQEGVIVTPHLGASTPESEDNCAMMAADEIKDYIENGNITNSVTMPALKLDRTGSARICVISKADENMTAKVSDAVTAAGNSVVGMLGKTRKDYGYAVVDTANAVSDDTVNAIKAIDGVISVRVI